MGMDKCFNIAGPCFPDEHYMLPALERLPGIMRIVEQRGYFVLPAQLVGYLDALGLEEGWMAVFDEDMAKSWDEKIYNRDISLSGKTLHIVGL